ncbi:NUDIX domain-containing protein [Nocardioides sp. TF02-7]|uniref:NUDIX domain-containing protein n=1 Tax=Nocardioides sp. TF02-7 TaxID=2917724 RepID=UPI001F06EECE|nr:NUDIX domain-containing protein [Nocardioides sp. TF02-7]UMG91091.1 NUDIX domain-containing protein [Nocardioides sp. TF02-7]
MAAAVREVAEETGLHVRLGPPLASQRYETGGRMKTVGYWTGRVVGDDDVSLYRPNDEIDRVEWVPVAEAPDRLTYPYDRQTLADALEVRRRTRALVVLRHGQARSRKGVAA